MSLFFTTLHILACFALIAIVLLQHGKGADMGAAFGGGASNTVFGARGAGNFLTKLTTGCVVVFMLTSITLSYFTAPATVSEIISESSQVEPVIEPEPEPEEPASSFPEAAPIAEESDVPSGFEEIPAPEPGSED